MISIKYIIAQAEYNRQLNHDIPDGLRVEKKRTLNKNTYCFYSKPHQVWFICSMEFIDNYDPNKSLEQLIAKKVFDEMVPSPGLYAFYNKDTQCAFLILSTRLGIYRDIDMKAYRPYYGFYQIPKISMIPTDKLQGCDGNNDENFLLDYSNFMDHIRDSTYIKRHHFQYIQKSQTQTIPYPGDETRDLMVRTSESYDGESVFRLSVSCPKITDIYLKYVDTG